MYITGYVAYQFRAKYPDLGVRTAELASTEPPTWICHISRGSLIYPSDELIQTAQILEEVFNQFHKDSLSETDLIFQKVAILVKQKFEKDFTLPNEVLLCLVRTRTYIRLRELNKKRKKSYNKIRIAARYAKNKFYA